MKKLQERPELSIIILTFNVERVIKACLDSVFSYLKKDWEVIVIDNNSTDKTVKILKQARPGRAGVQDDNFKLIITEENLGFAGGNNIAVQQAKGKYILFLNPDTIVEQNTISYCLNYLEDHLDVGAATVKIVLGNGKLDYSCHRGFPTPWNSLCFFSGLTKIFPKVKLFSGYTLGYKNLNETHEVDAINGAFFMIKKELGDKLNWFDTNFFWNGEDLDFCYRIKENGYKIMYLPDKKIIHFKGSSGGHKRGSKTFYARFEVMKLFYDKHYKDKYPWIVTRFIYLGIKIRKLLSFIGI